MTHRWARNSGDRKSRAIVGVAGGWSRKQGRGKSSETRQVKDTRWVLKRQQDQSEAQVIEGFVVDPCTDSEVQLVVHHLARPQHVIDIKLSSRARPRHVIDVPTPLIDVPTPLMSLAFLCTEKCEREMRQACLRSLKHARLFGHHKKQALCGITRTNLAS